MRAGTGRMLLGLALLGCLPSAAEPLRLRHRQLFRVPVDEPLLALAFVGDGRVLSLGTRSIGLWRLDDGAPRLLARSPLPVTTTPVRHPGALIVGTPEESAAWLLSSLLDGAQLARVDGHRLVLGDVALAAPWPNSTGGLRFRPGTNLVDGLAFAIVALDPVSRAVVRDDGMLMIDEAAAGVRVGNALASMWPDTLLASASNAPGAEDNLVVLRRSGGGWEQCWVLPLQGTVSALTARAGGRAADVLVALRTATGAELLRLELRPAQ